MAGQHPVAKERRRVKDREVSEIEKRGQRVKPLPYRLNLFFCWFILKFRETLFFPFCSRKKKKKPNPFSWNWQVFVSGQLTIFFLPVMKVVAGVNALGGNGGLFIPLKAKRHTCFAWSVICNCGIS